MDDLGEIFCVIMCYTVTAIKHKKNLIKMSIGKCLEQRLIIWGQFNFLLAHLSKRLIGELIGYPWSGVCRRPSTISNVFSSETTWTIKAKFYVQPPWQGGKKVYINSPGHMTKMADMPIYGKNFKKIFSRTRSPMILKLGMQHLMKRN